MKTNAFFLTGTGTDVGKTMAAAYLTHVIGENATHNPVYFKPIQCGAASVGAQSYAQGDAGIVQQFGHTRTQIVPSVYSLRHPVSPHLAFTKQNTSFELESIRSRLRSIVSIGKNILICEGAGGIHVPISLHPQYEMLDLAAELALPVLVVAYPGLGTLNHTLLTLECLERHEIPCAGFIFSIPNALQNWYTDEMVLNNIETIQALSGVQFGGFIPYCNLETGAWEALPQQYAALLHKTILGV
jgi:dethiobiotin synthetase